MCYMAYPATRTIQTSRPAGGQVGVRELRQNLSVYLVRIAAGETLEVTDRGRPVAVLAPLPPAATVVERLVASGRASVADRAGLVPIARLPPAPKGLGARLQRALRDLRRDTV